MRRVSRGFSGRRPLVPIVSDFLFDRPEPVLRELADLNSVHDVFLVMIDSAFAFEFQPPSAGWIDAYDVETGRSRLVSAGELRTMGRTVTEWQDHVERTAQDVGLEVLRLGAEGGAVS